MGKLANHSRDYSVTNSPPTPPLPIFTLVTLPVQLVLPLLALKSRTGVKSAYKMTAGWQVSVSACLCVCVPVCVPVCLEDN